MDLKTFMMGLVIFGIFTTGLWGMAGNLAKNTGVPVSRELDSLNKITEIETMTTNMQSGLNDPWGGLAGVIYTTIQAGYNVLKNLLSLVDIVIGLIIYIGTEVGIPSYITSGVSAIFMIFFIFSFLAYLRGGKD